mmetsp:Transcript_3089/g.8772  ORF Transcript_3089/g.8772 Transcript_3089/m.8772 type:complete len:177 (-) Transcript_3089:377-907(-)
MPPKTRREMRQMDTSSTLKTSGIWQNAIGYDPYKGEGEDGGATKMDSERAAGLLKLATMNNAVNEKRGACKKCGSVGHLTMQCRNFISTGVGEAKGVASEEESDIDSDIEIPSDDEELARMIARSKRGRGGPDDGGSSDGEARRERKRRKKEKKSKKVRRDAEMRRARGSPRSQTP